MDSETNENAWRHKGRREGIRGAGFTASRARVSQMIVPSDRRIAVKRHNSRKSGDSLIPSNFHEQNGGMTKHEMETLKGLPYVAIRSLQDTSFLGSCSSAAEVDT